MNLRGLVWRELIGSSHRRSTYLLRALYLGLTALLAFSIPFGFGREDGVWDYVDAGDLLVGALGWTQIFCLSIVALFVAHFSFAAEKDSGRLDLLLLTGKSGAGIVAGKLAGAMALPLLLLVYGLPAMFVAVSLGGVSGEKVLALTAATVALTLLMASFGAAGGAAGSLALTFLLPAFYLFGPMFLEAAGLAWSARLERWWLPYHILKVDEYTASFDSLYLRELIGPLAILLALSCLCLWVSAFFLPRPSSAWLADELRALNRKIRGWNRGLARGGVALKSGATDLLWSKPLLWREAPMSPLTTPVGLIALGVFFLAVWYLLWLIAFAWPMKDYRRGYLYELVRFLWAAALYLAPGIRAASAAARDKQRKTLELFLASPVPEWKVVLARVRSTATFFAVPLLFLVAFELVGLLGEVPHRASWTFPGVATTCSVLAFGCCCGAACGYYARTRSRAVLGYLGLLALWAAGPIVLSTFLDPWGRSSAAELVLLLSPLPALVHEYMGGPAPLRYVAACFGVVSAAAALYLSVRRLRSWLT